MKNKTLNYEGAPRRIVFVCNQLEINLLQGLIEAVGKDERFRITVIASECIETSFSPRIKQEEIELRLRAANIEHVRGADVELSDFSEPIFMTSLPYDIYMPEKFRSVELIRVGRLVNINYGIRLVKDVGIYAMPAGNNPYLERCSYVFVDERIKHPKINYVSVGSCKAYFYRKYFESDRTLDKNSKNMKIAWKPRWTLAEDSTLFPLLEGFKDFCGTNENLDLALIEHPLLRSKLNQVGKLELFEDWEREIRNLGNYRAYKSDEGLMKCLESDILISDISSTMYEFSFTGKPIIYTTHDFPLNQTGANLSKISYNTVNPKDVFTILQNLKLGIDPKLRKRKKFSKKNLQKLGNPYELILNVLNAIT